MSTGPLANEGRKRKPHTKSRKGCANCKLRRIKCDEGFPQCQKCVSYGVSCNYTAPGDETEDTTLQLEGEGTVVFSAKHAETRPMIPRDSMSPDYGNDVLGNMLGMELDLHETSDKYTITREDIDVFLRFKNRTVYTIGTAQSVHIYRELLVHLAATSPTTCLAHIVLALTLMHDRDLSRRWDDGATSKETFHSYHGSAIFNSMLSAPIPPEARDPLWATAALLGCATISSFDATCAEDAWPYRDSSILDLDWLRMSDGKKEVWRLTDPLRADSAFRDALSFDLHHAHEPEHVAVPELELFYPYLSKIYDFHPLVTTPEEEQDPYHTAASILVRLLELDCNHANIMFFLSFLGHMDPRYRALLHMKDPKALLLLAWWMGKMCQYDVWWASRRMRLEGRSICMYLERDHADQTDILRLLDYPKMMTGLGSGI